jgi:hypothetical protein
MRELRIFCRDVPDISRRDFDFDWNFPPDNPTRNQRCSCCSVTECTAINEKGEVGRMSPKLPIFPRTALKLLTKRRNEVDSRKSSRGMDPRHTQAL